jgi:hypothetical protein
VQRLIIQHGSLKQFEGLSRSALPTRETHKGTLELSEPRALRAAVYRERRRLRSRFYRSADYGLSLLKFRCH